MCKGYTFQLLAGSVVSIQCQTCHSPRPLKDIGKYQKTYRAQLECSQCGARYDFRQLVKKDRTEKEGYDNADRVQGSNECAAGG